MTLVECAEGIYDEVIKVLNVHSLSRLVEDVRNKKSCLKTLVLTCLKMNF